MAIFMTANLKKNASFKVEISKIKRTDKVDFDEVAYYKHQDLCGLQIQIFMSLVLKVLNCNTKLAEY